jgi:iron complex outermembrane receptor protein
MRNQDLDDEEKECMIYDRFRRVVEVNKSDGVNSMRFIPISRSIVRLTYMTLTIGLSLCLLASSARTDSTSVDLKSKSLEELADIEVTTVSKKAEPLSATAGAVYVITADDIQKMGATSIAEALRMAPGVQVARIDGSTWAITSRGFNGAFANKLLVLVDNRSAYTPLFSGVYWDVQDVVLEDIDRIEVVRGPGGTLWGANAVNGVINIITKDSKSTQGTLVKVGAGTEERASGVVRHGGSLGHGFTYRAYGKYTLRDKSVFKTKVAANDNGDGLRGGFRMDWNQSNNNSWTMLGDIYSGRSGKTYAFPLLTEPWIQTVFDTTAISGGSALARWNHHFSDRSGVTIQTYFDRALRKDRWLSDTRNTFDFEIQHSQEFSSRFALLLGTGLRVNHDDIDSTSQVYATPPQRTDNLFSAFAQMTIWCIPDKLRLSIGTKWERNDYSGVEFQPGARLLWHPSKRHALWASVSRALRTPSRAEFDAHILVRTNPPSSGDNPYPFPILLTLNGNRQFASERVLSYELGYRENLSDNLLIDLAVFDNRLDHLRTSSLGETTFPDALHPYVTQALTMRNDSRGRAYGIEFSSDWRATQLLSLRAIYSYLHLSIRSPESDVENKGINYENASPRNQVYILSSFGPVMNLRFDAAARFVDRLQSFAIPRYFELDIRLGWTPCRTLDLAVVGQNLLHQHHLEYQSEFSNFQTYVQRAVYATVGWRF